LTASLTLRSDPEPALVSVDEVAVGSTPLSSLALTVGTHQVRVERRGFESWTESLDAAAGGEIEREVKLRATGGSAAGDRRASWVGRGELGSVGPGVTPPLRTSGALPLYPEAAKGLRGTSIVELTVTEDGKVQGAAVVQSAGALLDAALLEA